MKGRCEWDGTRTQVVGGVVLRAAAAAGEKRLVVGVLL